MAEEERVRTVALAGGSFQNARLLAGVLVPQALGPNDGAISYGKAAVAAALRAREG